MEDMARLALVEGSVRDVDKFSKILYELLRHINHILENPHDYQLRIIKSNILKEVVTHDAVSDYLKYVGFELTGEKFVYPHQSTLSNLRMAQVAIERKINFCFGTIDKSQTSIKTMLEEPVGQNSIVPANVLITNNPFLLKIQELFNNMLVYEDPGLQALAREQVPIVTLQLMALDRVREQQLQIKRGETKGRDLPFDIALLMELLSWFKHKFFTWVDKPGCELCGAPTAYSGAGSLNTGREICRVELYKCTVCPDGRASFPRHNDPRTLLRTRSGRCGEWANAFTLVCRALGYDTRYVYDTSDHVWCEVFDYDSNTWLHADPCEAKLNTPLMYCHGWGKRLSYVIAVSRDDLQDVTWRYTTNHKEVLQRRTQCAEAELIECILALRSHRHRQLSEPRRQYLARRAAQELVSLMQERKPSDFESHGRISGSAQWRAERGEAGVASHTFQLTQPAVYAIRYHCGIDKYRITRDDEELEPIASWASGAYAHKHVFRKVENDWRQVYLAREEGEDTGSISWRISAGAGLRCSALRVRAASALYESGRVQWSVAFDERPPGAVTLGESPTQFDCTFTSVTLTAELSGGRGDVAWQHAQLFRQSLDAAHYPIEMSVRVDRSG